MNPTDPSYAQTPPGTQPLYPPGMQPPQPYAGGVPPQGQPMYAPAQQTPAPYAPAGNTPYDFIFDNQQQKVKKPLLGGNKPIRLLVSIVAIGIVLAIIGVVAASIFSKDEPTLGLTAIVQEQQEMIRIATQGEQRSTEETTRNLSYNIDLSVSTNQSQLIAYLAKHGTKLKPKELSLKQDASTDTLLANASATSTYDSALRKVLAEQLKTYLTDLQNAYKTTQSKTLKNILSTSFDAANTLYGQAKASASPSTTP